MSRSGSDGPLVSAARAGDEDAWRELYARHAGRLQAWLGSLPSGDWASAPEDVAAEAWLTAADKIGEFSGSDDAFVGWLFTIARLVLSNRRRTAQRRRTDPYEPDGADPRWGVVDRPDDAVLAHSEIRRILALLSPREAEVVACLEVVGLDVATTAQVLDMNPTAVRVARHRALRRLRTLLADHPLPP